MTDKFELPDLSGLRKRLSASIGAYVATYNGDSAACKLLRDCEATIDRFPAMVEEIGRLRKEVRFAITAHHGQAEDKDTIAGWLAKAETERDRLRSLNAEMAAVLDTARIAMKYRDRTELEERLYNVIRAILAKSEAAS